MTDRPVGTRDWRITRAINLTHTTERTQEEIADELGVSRTKVKEYLNTDPAEDVEEFLAEQQAEVRKIATGEYKRSLKEVGEQARTAEEPVKVWTDEDDELRVRPIEKQVGTDGFGEPIFETVDLEAVPHDVEMGPDTIERYHRREEMREIMRDMRQMVGADAPEESKHEITGEDGGPIEVTYEDTVVASEADLPDEPDQ
jgi:predicted transcriptional regulator